MANQVDISEEELDRILRGIKRHETIAPAWEIYDALLSYGKCTTITSKELAIEQSVDAFLAGAEDDPAYQKRALVDGVVTPLLASRKSTLECEIRAAPNTDLHIGDYVECLDERWIIVELFADKVGILNGTMWVCNDTLRFQNNSINVITRSCVIDNGAYSRKTSDPIVYVPQNTYKLYTALDADTKKLFLDKRLAFGKTYNPDGTEVLEVYKIIGVDAKSKNFGRGSHLLIVTLQRDVYNEGLDDIDNMLCDYYVESEDTPHPMPGGCCVILGRDTIRIGTTRKYIARFTDAQGYQVDNIAPIWATELPAGITGTTSDDGTLTIDVPMKESLIGAEIVLTLSEQSGEYGTFEKKVGVITVG